VHVALACAGSGEGSDDASVSMQILKLVYLLVECLA
jgi:hypothetical protein